MAGSGGQGILSMGQLLAFAGMIDGKEVSWMPSYGPEMRGGTANCSVIISVQKIASPVVDKPEILVALNYESFNKFAPKLAARGYAFIHEKIKIEELDSYFQKETFQDFELNRISAREKAKEMGDERFVNTIILGAVAKRTKVVSLKSLKAAVARVFKGKDDFLRKENEKAIDNGALLIDLAGVY